MSDSQWPRVFDKNAKVEIAGRDDKSNLTNLFLVLGCLMISNDEGEFLGFLCVVLIHCTLNIYYSYFFKDILSVLL